MAEVRVANAAQDFGTTHEQDVIRLGLNITIAYWSREAGPSGTRLKLGLRTEQVVATAYALVSSGLMIVPVGARVWPLGSLLPGNPKLFWSQLPLPVLIVLLYPLLQPTASPSESRYTCKRRGVQVL